MEPNLLSSHDQKETLIVFSLQDSLVALVVTILSFQHSADSDLCSKIWTALLVMCLKAGRFISS